MLNTSTNSSSNVFDDLSILDSREFEAVMNFSRSPVPELGDAKMMNLLFNWAPVPAPIDFRSTFGIASAEVTPTVTPIPNESSVMANSSELNRGTVAGPILESRNQVVAYNAPTPLPSANPSPKHSKARTHAIQQQIAATTASVATKCIPTVKMLMNSREIEVPEADVLYTEGARVYFQAPGTVGRAVCRHFLENKCDKGVRCSFMHIVLRPQAAQAANIGK